jgi:micrococcal nuclease
MNADLRRVVVRISVAVALFAGSGAYLAWALWAEPKSNRPDDRPMNVEVKRAVNGHTVKIDPDGKLTYAGIRAPYDNEPYSVEAKSRNDELVKDKELRLRFDGDPPDREDRIVAWAFIDDRLVNEILVREGLAYVRLTPEQKRFGDRLLDAQAEARSAGRGIWGDERLPNESEYPADPKHGNFHRPSCVETPKINASRRISFATRSDAIERGFAPCERCRP